MHVGVARFSGVEGADRALADAHDRGPGPGWLADAVVCEVHPNGRIVVRGTVAGRYVDVDGRTDPMGLDTGLGAMAGAAIGFALGPPAFAVGVVGGATAGAELRSSVAEAPVSGGRL
jgi:hypothetical protein